MAQISVVLAIAAPLLRARVRGIILQDPGTKLAHEALHGLDAAERAADLSPHVVLCDRQMLSDADFATLRIEQADGPIVVLVTVNSEGMPARSPIPLAGTVPFDTRSGDLASRLRAILHIRAAKPEAHPTGLSRLFAPLPEVTRLSSRFTVPEPPARSQPSGFPVPGRQPVPTKTAQLKKTSFLKSVLDDTEPAHRQGRATFLS